jgi:thioredoxin reductase (NADPH)
MAGDIRDIAIIGAGPSGLFGAFYAGMRGASVRLLDALPDLGGQLTALYPEKYIYDVAGFPRILAKDLVKGLVQQAMQFQPAVHVAQEVTAMQVETDGDGRPVFELTTSSGTHQSRTLLVTAGIGAFQPRRLPLADYDHWLGRGVFDKVLEPASFAGKRVLIVGGGDSAFDWALNLQGVARSVMMIHRRDGFRAHQATIDQARALARGGKLDLRTFWEVKAIHGHDRIEAVTLVNNRTLEEERLEMDAVIPLLGFVSRLGAIATWGLALQKDEVEVNQRMETNLPGVYAAGDIVTYPGKLKLIATGFAEACMAVNNAVHLVHPDRKAFPGHSSNMEGLFGAPAEGAPS